jgi:hypothetical protein
MHSYVFMTMPSSQPRLNVAVGPDTNVAVGPDTREGCHYISASQTWLD